MCLWLVALEILVIIVMRNPPDHTGTAGARLFTPNVPLTWKPFTIIAPFTLGVEVVGLLESPLTAKVVDETTDAHSRKSREAWVQRGY